MPGAAARNLHVPLPEEVHSELREASQQDGRPATAIARDAIEQWLAERRRRRIAEEITASISGLEGSELDLDPELESAGVECLRDTAT
jgi:predicted DNA-binding protein